jgi:hypothetical protein
MESVMDSYMAASASTVTGKGRVRAGWGVSAFLAAFMVVDAAAKFIKPAPVMEAFARSGWPVELASTVGAILLVCTLLYLMPRTAVVGAVLLTAYLGGAVATNLRLENPLFTHTLFPVYFGVLVWVGLWLRDGRVRALIRW